MKNKTYALVLFLVLFLSLQVSALKLTGTEVFFKFDFQPNYTREDSFYITNAEDYVESYDIYPVKVSGEDLSKYFTITPSRIENNPTGGSASFNVKLQLPEKLESPGENEMFVKVKIDTAADGAMRAIPSVALRYVIFVLYPFKFNTWSFYMPDMNVNETKEITLTVNNIGEPVIGNAYADIVIINKETNETIRKMRTEIGENIAPRETRLMKASFDSTGLMPGEYVATPVFHWDNNISYLADPSLKSSDTKTEFRIGEKGVIIRNFTKSFEADAINKMDIIAASTWNTKIKNMYGDIDIYDLESKKKIKSFRSLSYDLDPWQVKTMDAYFDTKGIEKKEYRAVVALNFEGSKAIAEDIITIGEDINAVTVEEIPGKFKFALPAINFTGMFTLVNFLVFLLLIFAIVNLFLFFSYFRKKKVNIDPAVLERIKELKKKYSDDYIRENMLKKGWEKEKIDMMLRLAEQK